MAFKGEINAEVLDHTKTGHAIGDIYKLIDSGELGGIMTIKGTFVKWTGTNWQAIDEHYALAGEMSDVAFSGEYADLRSTPTIPSPVNPAGSEMEPVFINDSHQAAPCEQRFFNRTLVGGMGGITITAEDIANGFKDWQFNFWAAGGGVTNTREICIMLGLRDAYYVRAGGVHSLKNYVKGMHVGIQYGGSLSYHNYDMTDSISADDFASVDSLPGLTRPIYRTGGFTESIIADVTGVSLRFELKEDVAQVGDEIRLGGFVRAILFNSTKIEGD